MKLWRCILPVMLLMSSVPSLPGESGNEQELQDIRRRIAAEQRGIDEVRKNKAAAQKNLRDLRRRLGDNTRRLSELQRKAENFNRDANAARDSLQAASTHFSQLDRVTNDLFLRLFQLDNQRLYTQENRSDRFMIASLLSSSATELQQQSNVQQNLAGQLADRTEAVRMSQWQSMVANENAKDYQRQIKELGRSISGYESSEAQHRQKIRELEQNARDLEALIARLKATPPPVAEDHTPVAPPRPGKMSWPVRGTIVRGYGQSRDPAYNTVSFNKGIDISVPVGGRISATDAGIVVYAEWYESLGKVIIIDHQNGLRSVYSHVDRLMVSKGDRVTKGQQIGAGSGGHASEIHFELRQGNQPVNPMNYLD